MVSRALASPGYDDPVEGRSVHRAVAAVAAVAAANALSAHLTLNLAGADCMQLYMGGVDAAYE